MKICNFILLFLVSFVFFACSSDEGMQSTSAFEQSDDMEMNDEESETINEEDNNFVKSLMSTTSVNGEESFDFNTTYDNGLAIESRNPESQDNSFNMFEYNSLGYRTSWTASSDAGDRIRETYTYTSEGMYSLIVREDFFSDEMWEYSFDYSNSEILISQKYFENGVLVSDTQSVTMNLDEFGRIIFSEDGGETYEFEYNDSGDFQVIHNSQAPNINYTYSFSYTDVINNYGFNRPADNVEILQRVLSKILAQRIVIDPDFFFTSTVMQMNAVERLRVESQISETVIEATYVMDEMGRTNSYNKIHIDRFFGNNRESINNFEY